jgi:hypothetical protein
LKKWPIEFRSGKGAVISQDEIEQAKKQFLKSGKEIKRIESQDLHSETNPAESHQGYRKLAVKG